MGTRDTSPWQIRVSQSGCIPSQSTAHSARTAPWTSRCASGRGGASRRRRRRGMQLSTRRCALPVPPPPLPPHMRSLIRACGGSMPRRWVLPCRQAIAVRHAARSRRLASTSCSSAAREPPPAGEAAAAGTGEQLRLLAVSERATSRLAALLAEERRAGDCYCLFGDVGAGKSFFRCVRGCGAARGAVAARGGLLVPCTHAHMHVRPRPRVWPPTPNSTS